MLGIKGQSVSNPYSPPREEGWTPEADGVVEHATCTGLVIHHPVCASPQPPLLTRRGMAPELTLNVLKYDWRGGVTLEGDGIGILLEDNLVVQR
jgi:hypothetical protein